MRETYNFAPCSILFHRALSRFTRDIGDNIIVLNRYSTLSRHVTSCSLIESTISFKHGNTIFRSLVNCHVARCRPVAIVEILQFIIGPRYINIACTYYLLVKKPIAHRENGIRGVVSLGRCARETCATRSLKEETS